MIVERLPIEPPKPQDIVIERWLAYARRVRNVIFNPAAPIQLAVAEKNLVIEWEAPEVNIEQTFNFLGITEADPMSYIAQYGTSLVETSKLPKEAARFEIPAGHVLAAETNPNQTPILKGDIEALRKIDLNCHGLNEYVNQI